MKYKKDFDKWNKKKQIIDKKEIPEEMFFNEREIWWGSLGINIGYEQDGKNDDFERPLLIIKKFNKYVVWVLPLTTSNKSNRLYYKRKSRDTCVILSQIRLVSTKRFLRLIETINDNEFKDILDSVKNLFPQ